MRFRGKKDTLTDRADAVCAVLSVLEILFCSFPLDEEIQLSTRDCEGLSVILGACAETLDSTE